MSQNKLRSQLLYVPNKNTAGNSEFKGSPEPTGEVTELIGDEGVEFIRKKLQGFIKTRKEMFGCNDPDWYGMYHKQRFFDLKNLTVLLVSEILPDDYEFPIPRSFNQVPIPKPRDFKIEVEPASTIDDENLPFVIKWPDKDHIKGVIELGLILKKFGNRK